MRQIWSYLQRYQILLSFEGNSDFWNSYVSTRNWTVSTITGFIVIWALLIINYVLSSLVALWCLNVARLNHFSECSFLCVVNEYQNWFFYLVTDAYLHSFLKNAAISHYLLVYLFYLKKNYLNTYYMLKTVIGAFWINLHCNYVSITSWSIKNTEAEF